MKNMLNGEKGKLYKIHKIKFFFIFSKFIRNAFILV